MDFFELLSDSIKMLTTAHTALVKKGPGGLGSCWEGGGCSLPSVDNHDLV